MVLIVNSQGYLEPSQTSNMEIFPKTANHFAPSRLTCLSHLHALLALHALRALRKRHYLRALRALFVRVKIVLRWICSPAETFNFPRIIEGTTNLLFLSGSKNSRKFFQAGKYFKYI